MTAQMDQTDLLWGWITELAAPDTDPVVVATLEAAAMSDGWHPIHAFQALTAADWSPDLHPRGRDGKFIEKLGVVKLSGLFKGKGGNDVNLKGQRGTVRDIVPDPKRPGSPDVVVELRGKGGKSGPTIRVKPDNVEADNAKGFLDRVLPSRRNAPQADAPERPSAPAGPPKVDPAEVRKRELRQRVKGISDEALAAQQPDATGDARAAIDAEIANRAARRADDDARRQALIDDINADAANLSTTDPEERARGLDDILAKLRFSIIDTDKVHDNIYPPGESGRWTRERAGQHEDMWNEVLGQVEASSIPTDRDALVLGGLPGAGKSFTLRPGQKAASFGVVAWEPGSGAIPPGATHVSINPDIVKEMLIARGMLPEGISSDLKPMEQVTFLHEESSYIAKLMSKRLGDLGYNVVLDNTMDSEGGMLKRMTPLAREGYKFRGIFVDIPIDESKASAKKRYIDGALSDVGGRFVPSSVQGNRQSSQGNMSKNRDAMDTLVAQDWFTDWMIVDNTGITNRTPKGDIVGQGTGAGSAADRYLPGAPAAQPRPGPRLPGEPEAPPTIDVNAPVPVPV